MERVLVCDLCGAERVFEHSRCLSDECLRGWAAQEGWIEVDEFDICPTCQERLHWPRGSSTIREHGK